MRLLDIDGRRHLGTRLPVQGCWLPRGGSRFRVPSTIGADTVSWVGYCAVIYRPPAKARRTDRSSRPEQHVGFLEFVDLAFHIAPTADLCRYTDNPSVGVEDLLICEFR